MKTNKLFYAFVMVIVLLTVFVPVAYALSEKPVPKIYGVEQLNRPINGLKITGLVSCQTGGFSGNAYAITSVDNIKNEIRIIVYEKVFEPKIKCRPASFSLSVKPVLASGKTYQVYVNNHKWLEMIAK